MNEVIEVEDTKGEIPSEKTRLEIHKGKIANSGNVPTKTQTVKLTKYQEQRHSLAPRVREAFNLALVKLKQDNKEDLSDLIYKELRRNPLNVLKIMAKFVPKEVKATIEETNFTDGGLSDTLRLIREAAGIGANKALPKPVPGGSVFPIKIRTEEAGRGEPVDIQSSEGGGEKPE